jgi:hypothetical protein
MHLLKVPIMMARRKINVKARREGKETDVREVLKFSSGEFLMGPAGLIKLQDVIYEEVGRKWGLERGERGSEARHTNLAEWKRELSRKAGELDEQEKLLKVREESLTLAEKTIYAVTSHLIGTTKEKRKAFWAEFFKRIPVFISDILQKQ